ncbi:class I SAM-dependent methyltransferase [Frigoribacterium sp. PvP032]|uniref:class I SAM-dependent methyltransferase n=1 Tax=Frigoribacterium sp. PvP032 TaxID=2806589 RepID=UPI001B5326B2|nr:class I SAM-dependent methyltransferase [Frigoribacterium sp. PvP032]MBP1189744.1 SAM-dependent methyltransferase [Frigoribacterium sp. PvP032]
MQRPPSEPGSDAELDVDAGAGAGADAGAGAGVDAVAVRAAYSSRATEYAAALGSMSAVHPADLGLVSRWADELDGPVLDLGCGPGHWTAFLAKHSWRDGHSEPGAHSERGGHSGLAEHDGAHGRLDVTGVDPVPAFVEHASRMNPGVRYETGSAEDLRADDASLGGVLAWYSLIHHSPDAIDGPLREVARVLRPGGRLLVGFFEAEALGPFDHAVVTAWRWPVDELAARLEAAGLTVLETTTRIDPGSRPHGALIAEHRVAR